MGDQRRTSARISDDESAMSRPLDGLSWLHDDETSTSATYDGKDFHNLPTLNQTQGMDSTNDINFQDASHRAGRNDSATHIDIGALLGEPQAGGPPFDGPYDFELPSDSSTGSVDSFESSASISWRRKRKRGPVRHRATSDTSDSRRYQCTFCTDTFKNKYDWQRHEASKHLSLGQWKCAKLGPFKEVDGSLCCIFCGQPDPTADHLEEHNYTACLKQPDEARTFCRKDHLRQHLRLFHRGCMLRTGMEDWRSSIELVRSRCGFCDAQIESWTARQRHLAEHFRNGSDMVEWKGGRGFDTNIERLVENDMPAFLIGRSRRTMEPFSATQASHVMDTSGFRISHGPNEDLHGGFNNLPSDTNTSPAMHSFRHIESLLLRYVSNQITLGHVPTDQELQNKTSHLIHGPGNTWDQTWADEAQWLGMFKKKAGLISLPLSGGRNAFIGTDVS